MGERKKENEIIIPKYGLDSMPKLLEDLNNLAKADRAKGKKGG